VVQNEEENTRLAGLNTRFAPYGLRKQKQPVQGSGTLFLPRCFDFQKSCGISIGHAQHSRRMHGEQDFLDSRVRNSYRTPMKKQSPVKNHRVSLTLPAIIFAILFIFAAASCTHLPRPVENIGQSSEFLDGGKNQPGAKDRARHTLTGKRPFEWWYFDGHLDTGETFVGVFFDPNFTNGKPGATFSLYSPDWKKMSVLQSLQAEEMKSSTEDVQIACPLGFVRRMDDKQYHVRWNMEGVTADFKLTMTAPGWMLDGQDESRDFFWSIHQARNRIEGAITQNGQTRQVKGEGYADHNWGRKPLNEITRDWVWGRIFSDEYTIVYADVDYIDPAMNRARPLYIARGDKIIVGAASPTVRQRDFATHPVLKRHYPKQVLIDFEEGGVGAHLNIRFKALVEEVDLLTVAGLNPFSQWIARTFIARPVYFRIIADYQGDIIEHGKATPIAGECLYEIMGFE